MGITKELIQRYQSEYENKPANLAVESAVAKVGLQAASFNQETARRHNFQFSDQVKHGKITEQNQSGRCWMFAALNTARVAAMDKYNIETLEFSQTYTFFWDKLERSNYFLESIIDTVEEARDSRLVAHLLACPLQDGGQWDMFSGILEKYGVVPKEDMPETYHSSKSGILNEVLNSYLRYYASEIREKAKAGADKKALIELKEDQLSNIYNILVKALGKPPVEVTYEFRDKDKKFHRLPTMTPQEFFKDMVGWNLEDKVSIIHAPTEDKPFGRAYTIKYLGSIKEGRPICYVNTPVEVLKDAAIAAIKAGEPVWFGCDVGKNLEGKMGIMDHETYRLDEVLGSSLGWTKAKRLDYGESCLTHAMVLTGVDLDENGKPIKWEVENSWGKDRGKDGMYSMSDEWFDEFVYQIMIDKKYVEPKWLKALEEPVIELEPWDPIGTLAL